MSTEVQGWTGDNPEYRVMPMGREVNLRYRVNVATSVKGVKTWDCTVDGEWTMEEILKKSDELVAALELRYPSPVDYLSEKRYPIEEVK